MAFLSIDGIISMESDPSSVLQNAADSYSRSIRTMRLLLAEIQAFRKNHTPTPARKIWQLGDTMFGLRDNLEHISLQIDGFYDHLVRDLGVKRKWLEKVVILRRYLVKEELIPSSLNWGRCEKGTRKVAERLLKGDFPV